MKKSLLLLPLAFVLENVVLVKWYLSCKDFTDSMHLTSSQLSEYLTRDIHNEQHVPLLLVRLFFNKPVAAVFWGLKPYLTFFDIPFLVMLLSVVGCAGILFALWFFVTRTNKRMAMYVFPVLLLLLPLAEVILHDKLPFGLRLSLIAVPFEFVSLYGIYAALSKKKTELFFWIILIACLLSLLLLFAFPTQLYTYCIGR